MKILCGFSPQIEDLEAQWSDQTFRVALLGGLKRGKTSIVNAFTGEGLLPTAQLPVTDIVTEVRHAHDSESCLVFLDRGVRSIPAVDLSRYLLEANNPHNRMQVKRILIRTPHWLFKDGISLADTPSQAWLGSNDAEEFLEGCSAAIVVLSVESTVTQEELRFISEVQEHVFKLIFVLNKSDLVIPNDGVLIADFTFSIMKKHGIAVHQSPFLISALSAIRAIKRNDGQCWMASGFPELSRHLGSELFGNTTADALKQRALADYVHERLATYLEQARILTELESQFLDPPADEYKEMRLQAILYELKELSQTLKSC